MMSTPLGPHGDIWKGSAIKRTQERDEARAEIEQLKKENAEQIVHGLLLANEVDRLEADAARWYWERSILKAKVRRLRAELASLREAYRDQRGED